MGVSRFVVSLLHAHAPLDYGPDTDDLHTCLLLGEARIGMMIVQVRRAFTLCVETSVRSV